MFQELANDLRKVMSTKYRKVKPQIIRAVRDAGLSLIELKHIEDDPDYLTIFDESSDDDVNLVYAYAKIFADAMPDDIDLNKYFNKRESDIIEPESNVIFNRAYKISDKQYACSISVKQAARLFRANKIMLNNNVWVANKKYKKQSDIISDKIVAGSYYYRTVYCVVDRMRYDGISNTIMIGSTINVIDGADQIKACSTAIDKIASASSDFVNDTFPFVLYMGSDVVDMLGEFGSNVPSKAARVVMSYVVNPEHGMDKRLIDNFYSANIGAFNIRIMAERVDHNYNVTIENAADIAQFLVDYFNEFARIFDSEVNCIKSSVQYSILFTSISNVWHICLSSLIYYDLKNDPDFNWRSVMSRVLDIDWSSNGELANSLPTCSYIYSDVIETYFRRRYNDVKKQSI